MNDREDSRTVDFIGSFFRGRRRELGLTQAALAQSSEGLEGEPFTRNFVANLECGRMPLTLLRFRSYMETLGLDLRSLEQLLRAEMSRFEASEEQSFSLVAHELTAATEGGRFDEALRLLDGARREALFSGVRADEMRVALALGQLRMRQKMPLPARRHLEEALRSGELAPDEAWRALVELAACFSELGLPDCSASLFERLETQVDEFDASLAAAFWSAYGAHLLAREAHQRAADALSRALARSEAPSWVHCEATSHWALCGPSFVKAEEAREAMTRALENARSLGSPLLASYVLLRAGRLSIAQDDNEQARLTFEQALALNEEIQLPYVECDAKVHLSLLAQREGEVSAARRLFEAARAKEPLMPFGWSGRDLLRRLSAELGRRC